MTHDDLRAAEGCIVNGPLLGFVLELAVVLVVLAVFA